METRAPPWARPLRGGLGNFLSGMETFFLPFFLSSPSALETSLVEWKPTPWGRWVAGQSSLETSLVEWKHLALVLSSSIGMPLGNFLSGMETRPCPWKGLPSTPLGNFLSGMETWAPELLQLAVDVPWKLP